MKMKKAIWTGMALMLVVGLNQVQAQPGNRTQGKQKAKMQLTEVQKEQLKSAKLEFAKATKDTRNELNELKAHQRTLMSSDKLDENKVYANIDKMTVLQKKLMKERINMQLTTCKLFSDEQRQLHRQKPNRNAEGMKQGRGRMHKGRKAGVGNRRSDRGINALDLSDEQKEKMKTMKIAQMKASQNLREEKQELQLKQKHLLNDEQPNKTEIMSNIDRISVIQNQLAKQKVKLQKQIRQILNDDQLVLFLAKPQGIHKHRKARMHRRF